MGGFPMQRRGGDARLRWGRELQQRWPYGLGAVLLGVLLPVVVGVPHRRSQFGHLRGEVVLGVVLALLFGVIVLLIAAAVGKRLREVWYAVGIVALLVAHPVLTEAFDVVEGRAEIVRIAIGTTALVVLAGAVVDVGWFGRALVGFGSVLALGSVGIAAWGVAVGETGWRQGQVGVVASLLFFVAAAAIGGVGFIVGQRMVDGSAMATGTTALAIGFGGILQLGSGQAELTVGVAMISAVAAVAAVAAACMAVLEAQARREAAKDALALSQSLKVARLSAQSDRFAEAAHDQRNALMAIEAAAQRMQREPSGELAAAVAAEAARLQRLLAPTAAAPVRFAVLPTLAPMVVCARALGADIRLRGDEHLEAFGDTDDFVEIVGELVDNARVHGAGPVSVTVQRNDAADAVEIDVRDEGSGVPEALRDAVFERGVTTDPAGHTGLGLFTARRMAVEAGGSLEIVGARGNVVRLRLPMRPGRSPSIDEERPPMLRAVDDG